MNQKMGKEFYRDHIRGCLVGLAAGDALGYPFDGMDEEEFAYCYGKKGIQGYALNRSVRKAQISSNTQMALFTANGILFGYTRGGLKGIGGPLSAYVEWAYYDWYRTQTETMEEVNRKRRLDSGGPYSVSWLLDVPELYARRNPGGTNLRVLSHRTGSIEEPVSSSTGCGALARVAPVALCTLYSGEDLDHEGAEIAALTHGHYLGYMPAAVLTHILSLSLAEGEKTALKAIILKSIDTLDSGKFGQELRSVLNRAAELSANGDSDAENIPRLGRGRSAKSALAIAVYCALRHPDDFSGGIIAAVSNSLCRSSVGAVAGAILGARLGYKKIDQKWKKDLELSDVILELSDDLFINCTEPFDHIYNFFKDEFYDKAWGTKYYGGRRPLSKEEEK